MAEKDDKNSLDDHGIFLFSGEVEDDKCEDAIRFVLESNLNGELDHITMIINSPGGFVNAGFSVIDTIEGSKIPVHTVGLGLIASMGLNLFITGKKGSRVLTPNTMVISHQWSGVRYGKEHELIASQKRDSIVTDMILRHYKKHTGLSEKDIRKYLLPESDVYLTSKEAKKLGICDIVKDLN
jgi:ATP-dependent Clp protease, protease subunit